MFERIKKFCDFFLDLGLPGFDLAVFHNGACVLRYRNGYSDLENKVKMNGRERYNIYSCSKVIACTAAMQLWERGLFSLDDPLSDYMPEFVEMTVQTEDGIKTAEHPILIRHLFEMTAGFSYHCQSPQLKKAYAETDGMCPTRETMKYLAKEPLLFEPGDRWEYSLCHDVLAAFVEVVSGIPFYDYVRKNIFDPLGMDDSTFMLPDEELPTIAPQYRFENGTAVNVGQSINGFKLGRAYASGGAGCISTVDDYMKFLEALRVGDIVLKRDTVSLMATNRLSEYQSRTYWNIDTHGYGLGVRCPHGDPHYMDFGWGGAACAFLAMDRENAISLYFGAHMLASPTQGISSMLYRFARAELFGGMEYDSLSRDLAQLYNYHLA